MIRLPPSSTRTDTLFPYPTLFPSPQSQLALAVLAVAFNGLDADAERLGNDLIAFTGTDASEHLALTHTERQWRGFQRRPQWTSPAAIPLSRRRHVARRHDARHRQIGRAHV